MESALLDIGLNEKETALYLKLIENRPLTASEISKLAKETRTNTYMLLESLQVFGLVEFDDTQPVRRFVCQPPAKLHDMVIDRQQQLKQVDASLRSVLPELSSKYRLAQHKTGVIYREGLDGLRDVLEDMVRSQDEILLIPSSLANEHAEAFEMLKKAAVKRKAHKIGTRAVMFEGARDWDILKFWPKQGIETRFLGQEPYDGEVLIYGETCVFVEYAPDRIITTTLTNAVISTTMKQLFEQLWRTAKP